MNAGAGYSTKNIHSDITEDKSIGSINSPIYTSSTFKFPSAEAGARRFALKEAGTIYSRVQNPTVESLEKKLARLENTDDAICLASGMNAITTVLFHFLSKGDRIIAHSALYGGTYNLIYNMLAKYGIEVDIVDFTDLELLNNALKDKAKILYFESPTNPLLEIIDIKKIADLGKKHNCLSIIDNTFAPPFIQYPINNGIDIVVHSLTKYINGHSDVIAGAIVGPNKYINKIRYETSIFLGGTMSPFTAYLISRGMETLKERLNSHCQSALKIANWLSERSEVEKVYYPGIKSHPNHSIAKNQMNNRYGGVLSFTLTGGYQAGVRLMERVKLAGIAVSLGGTHTLIEHPASMTHSEYTKKQREKAGIYDGLVRLAIGLEETEDIIADISQAFK